MLIAIKTIPHNTTGDRLKGTWQRAAETDFIQGARRFDHFALPLVTRL